MDLRYNAGMDIDARHHLARTGDISLKACAIRLSAARIVAGASQKDIAAAVGIRKTAYSNMEVGRSFPSRDVMRWFYRLHRIDFNFLIHGDFAQLPGDVQERLFSALAAASSEWDRRQG
ncbi:MAG: helix-turn-helix domain-containing protein [Rhodobacteraceae bacterium]|jgi:DNA-binding XRE family transcriptional regulator|nr:helix-turn-helix domain-containing protein [Paracoccaceae bacterium]